jgi:radical SAM superfamily enzyme YgiQ (UPF0313 family)
MPSVAPSIILTADETMMSRYRGGIFLGFATCAPQGILPDWLFFLTFAPPVPRVDGRAVYADSGIRLIESSLLANGFTEDEVAVVHPRDLSKMVGKETGIISISGHDLLGINPPTSTFVDMVRTGPPLNRVNFLKLMGHPVMKKVTTVVGGKAAWQVAHEPMMDRLGIDHVHLGEGEVSVPKLFRAILAGEEVPRIIQGEDVLVGQIPRLRHATIHGLVEISRGCVRGCRFCTPMIQRMRHKPLEQILEDVRLNIRAGNTGGLLHAEDVLMYGSFRLRPEHEKVVRLIREVAQVPGVTNIGLSHLALATVYHHPDLLEEVSEIMAPLPDQHYHGVQTGIETGSTRLMERYMRGKSAPSSTQKWPEIVTQSLGLMHDQNWVPACTMISGLPEEEEEDVLKTIELMDDLKGIRAMIVPMNFVSMDPAALSDRESFTIDRMKPAHWQLMAKCVEHDVQVARDLIRTVPVGNVVMKGLFSLATGYMMRGAWKSISIMREGLPPLNMASTSYLVPQV